MSKASALALNHVGITVPDIFGAIDWYVKVFGASHIMGPRLLAAAERATHETPGIFGHRWLFLRPMLFSDRVYTVMRALDVIAVEEATRLKEKGKPPRSSQFQSEPQSPHDNAAYQPMARHARKRHRVEHRVYFKGEDNASDSVLNLIE